MHFVYILHSDKLAQYYTGQTSDVAVRLAQHNSEENTNQTNRGRPWKLMLVLDCESLQHALKVETHIKRMKSRKYIENLLAYVEMREVLLKKYLAQDC